MEKSDNNINSQSMSDYTCSYSTQTISTYSDSNCTPFPSMTKSQKVKLNEILHREPIGYVSTFENFEIIEPVKQNHVEEPVEDESVKQNENQGCCVIS